MDIRYSPLEGEKMMFVGAKMTYVLLFPLSITPIYVKLFRLQAQCYQRAEKLPCPRYKPSGYSIMYELEWKNRMFHSLIPRDAVL